MLLEETKTCWYFLSISICQLLYSYFSVFLSIYILLCCIWQVFLLFICWTLWGLAKELWFYIFVYLNTQTNSTHTNTSVNCSYLQICCIIIISFLLKGSCWLHTLIVVCNKKNYQLSHMTHIRSVIMICIYKWKIN